MIFDGEKEKRPVEESFDYVIIGSGAAGATAAKVLADSGATLAVVEEGPAVETREFNDRLYPSLRRLYRCQGAQLARGRAFIPVLQGSCLGGSTVVNSAIVWRIPEDVWEPWKTEHGLGEALPLKELERHWELIERELGIRATAPEVWGANNALMEAGRRKLGVSASPTRRNEKGCRGSARCITGCPHGAKQSMLVSYLPYALKRGATIYTSARAERVVLNDGRATAVEGSFRRTPAGAEIAKFRLRARKAVLVAASAVQTPGLLARSGVRGRHLGAHFQAHPGTSVTGVFDREVGLWFGATQGFDADEHRSRHRFKIETLSLPPETLFSRLPGVGPRWVERMAESSRMAVWAVQLRAYAEGSVREGPFGADIRFDLERRDIDNLRKGLRFTAELLFAAGAREVLPGVCGLPESIGPGEIRLLDEAPEDPRAYSFILSHLFGTARMSLRPEDGVVGPDFAVHGTKNLYVIDSSVFPTNLGVNPQHPIMGVAMHATQRIAEAK